MSLLRFGKYSVCGREFVNHVLPEEGENLLIRVSTRTEFAPLVEGHPWTTVLELVFDDCDYQPTDPTIQEGSIIKPPRPMEEWQADQIVKEVTGHHWDHIRVHCDAGLSRSPAILLAIMDYQDREMVERVEARLSLYNRWVRRLLNERFEAPCES
jgi:predicted protein tyrosine phosphatase